MIVLSGLLVLVSIVLLLIGLLASSGLTLVYFSIGTSIAAGVFLVLGALQRRGETVVQNAGGAPVATDGYERVTAVTVTRPDGAAAAMSAASGGDGALVSIVPGRPRYHTASCRFLAGRSDVTQVPVGTAQADGYSACGVCKPDAAVAPVAEEPVVDEPLLEVPAAEEEPVAAPARKRTAAATRVPAKKAAAATATKAPATRATATKATATKATATKATATKAAAKPAAKTAEKAAAKAAVPAKAASAAGAATVVVIPDRGKFHVETCRFVRDVPGTVTLAKTSAKRQGYVACGVCKP